MMDPQSRESSTRRTLLLLEFVSLGLGAGTFAIDPLGFIHPALAIAGIAVLAVVTLLVRVLPRAVHQRSRAHAIEIMTLLAYAAMMTASTGATGSPFLSLHALPVIAAALCWRRSQVLLLAVAAVALALVQTALLDAMNDLYLPTTVAILLNVLTPGLAAALLLASLQDRIGAVEAQATELAARDGLTGLLNLQAFDALLERHHRAAELAGQPYSLAIVDIDDLRRMNETLGHEAGSQMITAVATAITRSIRTTDHAARMGGDVFVILLVDADQATAAGITQRIRNNVYNATLLVESRLTRATVSIGVATFPRDEQNPKLLLILADQRMEQDKSLRRPPG